MVDTKASFTGSIPEFYDSCLGPAWFSAYAMAAFQPISQ